MQTHFCAPIGHVQVNGDYVESWQPHRCRRSRPRARAARVTGDLGRGIFGVERCPSGRRRLVFRVSPRPHDTGMVTMCTQAQNELEPTRAILAAGRRPPDRAGCVRVIYGGVARGIRYDDVRMRSLSPDLRLSASPRRTRSGDGRRARDRG
jgi:phosphoribosylglycinamide formyltransferase 2